MPPLEFRPKRMFKIANEYDRRAYEYGMVSDILATRGGIPSGQSGFHLERALDSYSSTREQALNCVGNYQTACVKAEDWIVAVVMQFYADEDALIAAAGGDLDHADRVKQSAVHVSDFRPILAALCEDPILRYEGRLREFIKGVHEFMDFVMGLLPPLRAFLPPVEMVLPYARQIALVTGDPSDIDAAGQAWKAVAHALELQEMVVIHVIDDGREEWKGSVADGFWERMQKVNGELADFGRGAGELGEVLAELAEGLDDLMACIVNCLAAIRSLLIAAAGVILCGVPGVIAGVFALWDIGNALVSLLKLLGDSIETGGLISDACAEIIDELTGFSSTESEAVPQAPAVVAVHSLAGMERLDDGPPPPRYERPLMA